MAMIITHLDERSIKLPKPLRVYMENYYMTMMIADLSSRSMRDKIICKFCSRICI